jgi:hypothetical protein
VRRAGRIADGWFPYVISPEDLALGAQALHKSAEAAGRNGDDIEITVWPGSFDPKRELEVAWIRSYLDAGASRIITRPQVTKPEHLQHLPEQIARFRSVVTEASA